MDELSFLIIDKLHNQTYYNTASLLNLYPRDPDLIGFRDTRLLQGFSFLIDQELLIPHPITGGSNHDKNYMLSEKGAGAYEREKQRRAESVRREELQIKQIESVIKTNDSVVNTNKSVDDTNASVRSLNNLYADNIPRQNKYMKVNIGAVVGSVLVAGALLLNALMSKPDAEIVKQLKGNNALLKLQIQSLNTILLRQQALDSQLSIKVLTIKGK
jgi:hypothetical protein